MKSNIVFFIFIFILLQQTQTQITTTCLPAEYADYKTKQCKVCPVMCQTCSSPAINTVICLSCAANSNREISSVSQLCLCKHDYIETLPIRGYCCHKYCLTCNETSCITCPIFTNRIVNNDTGMCDCQPGFFQKQNHIVCVCEQQSYFYLNRCFKCPLNCKTCEYKQQLICLTCNQNSNRNASGKNCACNNDFTETTPYISSFCYAVNCVSQQINCTGCNDPTILQNGLCACKIGYFLNFSNVCQRCQMEGCIDCKGHVICVSCQETKHFYLIQDVCAEHNIYNFIVTYDEEGHLIMQFDYGQQLPSTFNISAEVDKVLYANPDIIPPPLEIDIIKFQITYNRILTIWFDWKNTDAITTDRVMFLFEFDYLENESMPYNITSVRKNIMVNRIYPASLMKGLNNSPLQHGLSIVVIILSFAFYVYGYKYTQVIFFLQTLCMMGFSLEDDKKDSIIFLNNLRYSYYQWTNNNPIKSYPEIYIKLAPGNYNFLSIDDSYFRIYGWPFLFEIIILILFLVYLVSNIFIVNYYRSKGNMRALMKYFFFRKYFIRILQYFFFSTMYPLIFGAFQTYKNWNGLILVQFQNIKNLNKTFSIIMPIIFILIILWTWFYSTISKMSKIVHVIEILSCFITSIIIVNSTFSLAIICIIIVLAAKNLSYYFLRAKYISEQNKLIRLMWITVIFQTITIIITAVNSYIAMICLVFITVFSEIGLVLYILISSQYQKYRDKLTIKQLQGDYTTNQDDQSVIEVNQIQINPMFSSETIKQSKFSNSNSEAVLKEGKQN